MDSIKQLILESAEVKFLQHNYDDVFLTEICRDAGITTGAFYRRFSEKRELICVIVDLAMSDLKAGIKEYQLVQIVDVNNGNRFETYTIAGERGSGVMCLNGAAARCVSVHDKIILMAYAQMTPEEAKENKPKVVFVDDENKISRVTNYEKHGRLFDMERLG